MYLEKGMDGEGSLQYVGSGGLILRGKTRGGGGLIFGEERGTSYLHIKQSTYLICKIKIIYLIKFGNKFKCINLFHVQNLIFIAYFHSFFASFNFESDLIAENTGITAGSNLIPGPGRQFQVDTSESNLKLAGAQNRFKTGLKF